MASIAAEATLPQLGGETTPANGASADGTPIAPAAPARAEPVNGIRVRTDVLDLVIDTAGGDITRADLPTYPIDKADPTKIVRLLDYAPDSRWVVQTGIGNGSGAPEPNHLAPFTSERSSYELAEGQDSLVVTLEWTRAGSSRRARSIRFVAAFSRSISS